MQMPHPDTSEYAALVDFIATGGRSRDQLKRGQDASALIRQVVGERARTAVRAVVRVTNETIGRKH